MILTTNSDCFPNSINQLVSLKREEICSETEVSNIIHVCHELLGLNRASVREDPISNLGSQPDSVL